MRNLYEVLRELSISFQEVEHEPVYTIEQAQMIAAHLDGIGTKVLFLTDKRGRYFLMILEENKRANIKELAKAVGAARLSFADSEALQRVLGLEQGSVSPLGVIHDAENQVVLLLDRDLQNNVLFVHPNVNNKTMAIRFEDLIRLIQAEGHAYMLI